MFRAVEMPMEFIGAKHTDIVMGRYNQSLQHSHDYFELNFITSGKTRMKLNERIINYDSYDFILIPPQMKHVLYWSEYDKFNNYVIWFRMKGNMPDMAHALKLHDYDGEVQRLCAEIFRLYTLGDKGQTDIISAYLYAVLLHMRGGMVMNTERSAERKKDRIGDAIRYINLNIMKKPLSVRKIAEEIGYSPAHFAREFHRQIGVSPVKYLIDVRLAQAKRLLVETGYSVQDVSDMLFYDDPMYFSRQFSKMIGMPPTEYRKLYCSDKEQT